MVGLGLEWIFYWFLKSFRASVSLFQTKFDSRFFFFYLQKYWFASFYFYFFLQITDVGHKERRRRWPGAGVAHKENGS